MTNKRTAAILKWKRKSGRCNEILDKLNMIHNVYEFKKLYRQEAILRWKEKKVNAFKKQNKEAKDKKQHNSSTGNDNVTNIASTSTCSTPTPKQQSKTKGRCRLKKSITTPDCLPQVKSCTYCGAVKFYSETSNFCCLEGQIVLSNNELPLVMRDLLTSTSKEAKLFRTSIRTYNNHFAFTSLGVRTDNTLTRRNKGIYTFRVQGQMYHFINDLHPTATKAKNLQLYFHDTENEIQNRIASTPRLFKELTSKCIDYLQNNPYSKFFRNLSDIQSLDDYKIILRTIPKQDQRVYNKPEVSQGDDKGEHDGRNIEVRTHSEQSKTIQYYYGCYDPLQYPLMFPYGELGWHQNIQKSKIADRKKNNQLFDDVAPMIAPSSINNVDHLLSMEEKVLGSNYGKARSISIGEYYAYKLQIRFDDKSCLLLFGRLLQQYIVDNYVKLETQRLAYFRDQQQELRQEFLQGVVDAMAKGETKASAVGKRIVLPADFIGGPRNMRRKYIDAMALVQKFGKPDIFITITCNPNWPEIKEYMMTHEESQNRPDLIVRVFHAKLENFKKEIIKKELFGKVIAYTYVVEFQKRGLPHAHFLLILAPRHKMYNAEEYDEIVSAEIPCANTNPHLFKMVKKHMFHGPCGTLNPDNVCMKKTGSCKNSYPKDFCDYTTQTEDAYPTYRRRDTGVKIAVRGAQLDNRWVVPYNPYLICKFNCHVNVEICSTIKAVKYIYKYICKGCDKISFSVSQENKSEIINEIDQFQSSRWISPPEAAWRIFRFSLGEIKPSVIHLPLHLENYQPITFNSRSRLTNVIDNCNSQKTMLTEFFYHNKVNRFAQHLNLTYKEYPDQFLLPIRVKGKDITYEYFYQKSICVMILWLRLLENLHCYMVSSLMIIANNYA
ncbi:hypothetical protein LXL04_003728 [Taraxacum kok-saghyz]